MNDSIILFNEPELEFRYGQRMQDPHDGLALFGPYDADQSSKPGKSTYIVIGNKVGIGKFHSWSKIMNTPTVGNQNSRLWPSFPGYEAVFLSEWPIDPAYSYEIDKDGLSEASFRREASERAFRVVDYYLNEIKKAAKLDEKISVAICVVPDEVWLNCRPESTVSNPTGEMISSMIRSSRKMGQMEMFGKFDPDQYHLSTDFRRQLKARAMEFGIPLQIIRESTLHPNDDIPRGQRHLTPLSDRMWNLSTALYYKSGGKPWRLVTAREGVCYIGIAFRKTGNGNTACCAAQMFLNTGDGVVFLGEYGPWYSEKNNQFHLSRSAAHNLLEGILKTYRELGGKELTEIFLHSRSNISSQEFEGYQSACPPNVKLVGVRVQPEVKGLRLYRPGDMPTIRGSFWRLNDSSGLLWGNGFKPRLGTYDGWEIPVPLKIDIQYGSAPIERVAQDILGLTKLNYNSCRLGEGEPVTVGFSDAVGEILISNPTVSHIKPQFKFYI